MKRGDVLTGLIVSVLSTGAACGDSDEGQGGSSETDPATGDHDSGTRPGTGRTTGVSTNGGDAPDAGSDADDCQAASAEVVTETVSVTTSDDKEIVGTVLRPDRGSCLPAVLLVHQYMRDRWQWGDLPEILVQRGYFVLAIDLRGHGDSDEQDGHLPQLLTDPDQAPHDAQAALEWLQGHDAVESARIGMVGTSIGAYLAAVAVVRQWGVDTIVAISPLDDAIHTLAQHDDPIVLHDVYCIATEHDSEGAQARSCERLVETATGDARIEVFDTADHGVEILERDPALSVPIADWLDQAL
jgi:dienelactone hydrolase